VSVSVRVSECKCECECGCESENACDISVNHEERIQSTTKICQPALLSADQRPHWLNLIAANICDKYPVSPSIRPFCTN
jgi:hypothetical protein